MKGPNELLKTVGLAERKGVYPKQLSAGEQKRAVIARSLINRPEVILADEPTSDLDVQTEQGNYGLTPRDSSIRRNLHDGNP